MRFPVHARVSKSNRSSLRRQARRLAVEPLEDRRVLATVTLNTDVGVAGELRTEIAGAAAGETIDFNLSAGNETITLSMGELVIDKALTINGSNAAGSGTEITVSGASLSRVFNVDDGAAGLADVRMTNLTVTLGDSSADPVTTVGGGIRNTEALTLIEATVLRNLAEFGGGVGNTDGGTTTIRDSELTSNTATARGGGAYNNDGGTFDILSTTISGNVVLSDSMYSTVGGGASNFGQGSTMSIVGSTISGNSAGHDDTLYAASGLGGGVANDDYGMLTVMSSMITDNSADYGGGGWTDDYGVSSFSESTYISDNTTTIRGGGLVAIDGADVSISDSTVSGNAAPGFGDTGNGGDGAAIFATAGVNLRIDNTTIESNTSYDRGGAIYASSFGDATGLTISITNSNILNNSSMDLGGGINVGQAVTMTIEDSTLSGNSAADPANLTSDGGAIRMSGFNFTPETSVTIRRSNFTNNYSNDDGGAIGQGEGSRLVIEESYFDSNNAYDRGGAIYSRGAIDAYDTVFPSYLTISETTFTKNTAVDDGGAVHAGRYMTSELDRVTVTDNVAESRGGGLRFSFGDVDYLPTVPPTSFTLTNSTISGNSSASLGGGMYNAQSVMGLVQNTTFDRNEVNGSSGAGISNNFGGLLTVEESTISNNSASSAGGGILNSSSADPVDNDSSLTLTRSTVSNNTATATGGGIDTTNANLRMVQSTISGNSSTGTGGGVYLELDGLYYMNYAIEIEGSTITNNYTAASGGGIIAGYYTDPLVTGSIISGNSAAVSGPDAYAYMLYNFSYTLVGDNTGITMGLGEANPDASGNIVGGPVGGTINAMLAALADNGGPTLTHLPMVGSPAIDVGDSSILPGTTTDQRGFERVADGDAIPGAIVDMGSVEFGSDPPGDGDFNGDGFWDCDDINALTTEVAAGTNNPAFDLTSDGLVNGDDVDAWLVEGGAMNPGVTGGNPFLPGDANLDGVVDGLDFIEWNTDKFTSNSNWCDGDFNADGVVDGLDFIIWNTFKFTSSDAMSAADDRRDVGSVYDGNAANAKVAEDPETDDTFDASGERFGGMGLDRAAPSSATSGQNTSGVNVEFQTPQTSETVSLRRDAVTPLDASETRMAIGGQNHAVHAVQTMDTIRHIDDASSEDNDERSTSIIDGIFADLG